MLKKISFVVVFLFFIKTLYALHPNNYAVFNLELVNPNSATLSVQTNRSDFNAFISAHFGYKLRIGVGLYEFNNDDKRILEKYIPSVVYFKNLDYNITYTLDSIVADKEHYWIYFHLKTEGFPNNLTIVNKFLFDSYPKQKNLLIFVYNNKQKGLIFDRKKDYHTIKRNIW